MVRVKNPTYVVGRVPNLKIQPPIQHPSNCGCQRCGKLPAEERGLPHQFRIYRASRYPDDFAASVLYAREVKSEQERWLAGVPDETPPPKRTWKLNRRQRSDYEHVYVLKCPVTGRVKIGTTTNLTKRVEAIQALSPTELSLVCVFRGNMNDERRLHKRLAMYRRHGEWFELPNDLLAEIVRDLHEPDCY